MCLPNQQQLCAVSDELIKQLEQKRWEGKNVVSDDKQQAFEAQQEFVDSKLDQCFHPCCINYLLSPEEESTAAGDTHAQIPAIEVQKQQNPEDTKKAENKELSFQKPQVAVKPKHLSH